MTRTKIDVLGALALSADAAPQSADAVERGAAKGQIVDAKGRPIAGASSARPTPAPSTAERRS